MKTITQSQRLYLIQEAVLFLMVSYCILLGATINGLVAYKFNLINLFLIVLVGGSWLGWRFIARRQFPSTILDLPILALLIAYLVATVFSDDPRRSVDLTTQIIIMVLIFYLVVDLLRNGWPAELFTKVILLVSGFIIFFGLLELIQWYAGWFDISAGDPLVPPITRRVKAFLGHPNYAAAYLNLLLPLGLANLLKTSHWGKKIFSVVWGGVVLLLILFTSSRGGWLGTFAALGVFCFLFMIQYWVELRNFFRQLRNPWFWWILIIMGLIVLMGMVFLLLKWQSQHPSHPTTSWRNITGSRDFIWVVAWQSFLRNPLFGAGPKTFGTEYIDYHSVPPGDLHVHAHNYYLNTLTEVGLIGFLALLSVIVFFCIACFRVWQSPRNLKQRDLIAIYAALAGLSVHSLFDTPQTMPFNYIIAIILVAQVVAEIKPAKKMSAPLGGNLLLGAIWACVVLGFSWSVLVYHTFNLGLKATYRQDWEAAAEYFDKVTQQDPWNAHYWLQSGFAHGYLALDVKGELNNELELDKAIQAFEKGIELEPVYPVNRANLAVLYWQNEESELAIESLEIALDQTDRQPSFYLTLGKYYESLGQGEKATAAYNQALRLRSDWSQSYYFRETDFRKSYVYDWMADNSNLVLTRRKSYLDGWQALQKEEYSNAKDFFQIKIEDNNAEAFLGLGLAYSGLEQYDQAVRALETAAFVGRLSDWQQVKLHLTLGEIERLRGDDQAAVKAFEEALSLFEYYSSYGLGYGGTVNYGGYVFHRSSIPLDMLPGIQIIFYNDEVIRGMIALGDSYRAIGDEDAAMDTFNEILIIAPGSAEVIDRLTQ